MEHLKLNMMRFIEIWIILIKKIRRIMMIDVMMIMIMKKIMPKHPNILRLTYQDLVFVLEGTNCANILDNALVCSIRFDR